MAINAHLRLSKSRRHLIDIITFRQLQKGIRITFPSSLRRAYLLHVSHMILIKSFIMCDAKHSGVAGRSSKVATRHMNMATNIEYYERRQRLERQPLMTSQKRLKKATEMMKNAKNCSGEFGDTRVINSDFWNVQRKRPILYAETSTM